MAISNRISRLSGRIAKLTSGLRWTLLLIILVVTFVIYVRRDSFPVQLTLKDVNYVQSPSVAHQSDFAYIPRAPVERRSKIPEPIREYNPDNNQQIGILTSDTGVVLPLYGKQNTHRRNRYGYYTMSPGNQAYPVPLLHNGRNCMDDLGCPEFFGGEKVSMVGSADAYNVELYGLKSLFF
jgi:hypothetical protein